MLFCQCFLGLRSLAELQSLDDGRSTKAEDLPMRTTIRAAMLSDLEGVAELLLADAKVRCALDPELWKLDSAAREKILATVRLAMEAEKPAFRQQWLVADTGRDIIGVTHSILLPVPPIYAGEFGPLGLIMEDCFIKADAPPETRAALLRAAEADLVNAGARILLASSVEGGRLGRRLPPSRLSAAHAIFCEDRFERSPQFY